MKEKEVELTCAYCGKTFYSDRVRLYCSPSCKLMNYGLYTEKERKICPICGREFYGTKSQKICSAECRRKRSRDYHAKKAES